MSASELDALIDAVHPLDRERWRPAAQAHLDDLTKPPGSLGALEAVAVQLAVIARAVPAPIPSQPVVLVAAADHGVAAHGISAYPQQVTGQMVANFAAGGAAINALAEQAGARLVVADLGVRYPVDLPPELAARVIRRPLGPGTDDFRQGPAMSHALAEQALLTGAELFASIRAEGCDLLATGEMGIGNTTAAAAIGAAVSGAPASELVGRGTGVDDDGLARKLAAVEAALAANPRARHDAADADRLDLLAGLGGFEIGALAGAMLAAAAARTPVLLDGFISTAAALVACQLAPAAREVMIAGHRSQVPGHRRLLVHMELQPLLQLDLRLGEGSGAALAIPLVQAAARFAAQMATFGQAGVSGKEG